MKEYLKLWLQFFKGVVALIIAILYPIVWIALLILPYGLICLFTKNRLKKGYRYFYFLPTFIKEITKPLRKELEKWKLKNI